MSARRMRRCNKRMLREARGQATVEFILAVLFVMVMVFWALELVMWVYTYTVMAEAAKEGVRYAVVHGCGTNASTCSGPCSAPTSACTDASGANVIGVVKGYAQYCLHNTSGLTPAVTYLDSSAASPSRVQVVIQYSYQPYFSLPWSPPTIYANSEGRIVN